MDLFVFSPLEKEEMVFKILFVPHICISTHTLGSQDSVVCIATGCSLDDGGSEF
jgi:hypothetical protein